ncbi:hypothetical protein ACHHV8_23205 [Paenibacillus sp. TAB 01]|uniref:hypothetical protein n=1 Tax=Paenibacillus sp. TAB 01 TaxID=3368988 RepID=UPI003753BE4B
MSDDLELKVVKWIGKLSAEFDAKIDALKAEVDQLKSQIENQQQAGSEGEKLSVTVAREYIKNKISMEFPNLVFTNGSRAAGTKLTISDGTNTIGTLIRTSKSHRIQDGYPSGWINVDKETLSQNPLTFFVIEDFEGEFHTIIVPREQIKQWAAKKNVDSSGKVHFYLNLIKGQWIDDRDNLNYNFTHFAENWHLVKEAL